MLKNIKQFFKTYTLDILAIGFYMFYIAYFIYPYILDVWFAIEHAYYKTTYPVPFLICLGICPVFVWLGTTHTEILGGKKYIWGIKNLKVPLLAFNIFIFLFIVFLAASQQLANTDWYAFLVNTKPNDITITSANVMISLRYYLLFFPMIGYGSVMGYYLSNYISAEQEELRMDVLDFNFLEYLKEAMKITDKYSIDIHLCDLWKNRKPVFLYEKDLFTHIFIQGSTGSGKTSSLLKPILYALISFQLFFWEIKKKILKSFLKKNRMYFVQLTSDNMDDYMEDDKLYDFIRLTDEVLAVYELPNQYKLDEKNIRRLTKIKKSTVERILFNKSYYYKGMNVLFTKIVQHNKEDWFSSIIKKIPYIKIFFQWKTEKPIRLERKIKAMDNKKSIAKLEKEIQKVKKRQSDKTFKRKYKYQLAFNKQIKKIRNVAACVIEPKGDFTDDIAQILDEKGLPYWYIDARDPQMGINPLLGDPIKASIRLTSVLSNLKDSGKSNPYFEDMNEALCTNAVKLLKVTLKEPIFMDMLGEEIRETKIDMILSAFQDFNLFKRYLRVFSLPFIIHKYEEEIITKRRIIFTHAYKNGLVTEEQRRNWNELKYDEPFIRELKAELEQMKKEPIDYDGEKVKIKMKLKDMVKNFTGIINDQKTNDIIQEMRPLYDKYYNYEVVDTYFRLLIFEDDLEDYHAGDDKSITVEKFKRDTTGIVLRLQNLLSEPRISKILCADNSLRIEECMENSEWVLINTAYGEVPSNMSEALGTLIMMYIQDIEMARPGVERSRNPYALIVDELGRYLNGEMETGITLGRSFRVFWIMALQHSYQMVKDGDPRFQKAIQANVGTKIWYGDMSAEDAKEISQLLGTEIVNEVSTSIRQTPIFSDSNQYQETESYSPKEKERFSITELRYQKFQQMVFQMKRKGAPLPPQFGKVYFLEVKYKNAHKPHKSKYKFEFEKYGNIILLRKRRFSKRLDLKQQREIEKLDLKPEQELEKKQEMKKVSGEYVFVAKDIKLEESNLPQIDGQLSSEFHRVDGPEEVNLNEMSKETAIKDEDMMDKSNEDIGENKVLELFGRSLNKVKSEKSHKSLSQEVHEKDGSESEKLYDPNDEEEIINVENQEEEIIEVSEFSVKGEDPQRNIEMETKEVEKKDLFEALVGGSSKMITDKKVQGDCSSLSREIHEGDSNERLEGDSNERLEGDNKEKNKDSPEDEEINQEENIEEVSEFSIEGEDPEIDDLKMDTVEEDEVPAGHFLEQFWKNL